MPENVTIPAFLARLRRNHALEHATLHVLGQRYRDAHIVARSTPDGFILYGDLPTEGVIAATRQALRRLQGGQRELAIHPTCGTNLATAGILAGLGAFVLLTPRRRGWQEWLSRLPLVCVAATVGIIAGQRLGMLLQARFTTDAAVGRLRIVSVSREEGGPVVRHRIRTAEG